MDPKSAIVDMSEVHPVTPEMKSKAGERVGQPAPTFDLTTAEGKPATLASMSEGQPLLIFFINDGCPCCVTAEPFVERLAQANDGRAKVIGMINSGPEKAKAWQQANGLTFPLVLDPSMKTIQAYGAENGVYMALVSPDGQLAQLYPGYSADVLRQIHTEFERYSKTAPRPLDVKDAPAKPTSGCAFDFAEPTASS